MDVYEIHEWIELAALGALLLLVWDIHGYLRDISRQLARNQKG